MTPIDKDFGRWAAENADALENGRPVDVVNVAEQLRIIARLLPLELQGKASEIMEGWMAVAVLSLAGDDANTRSWRASILRLRITLQQALMASPSLQRLLTQEMLQAAYENAVAIIAVRFNTAPLPDCPFTWEQVLGNDYVK